MRQKSLRPIRSLLHALVPLLAFGVGVVAAPPVPLTRAHAHNDYDHTRALLDALEQGFCSVEADVWLVDGALLVAHDRDETDPHRTLQRLYLDPLRERISANGGRVFREGPPFTLMIDIKSDATNTYVVLRQALRGYESFLTRFHSQRRETNAVTIVISGNRPRGLMASETVRLAGYDGRLEDLEGDTSPHFMPWVSDNWSRLSDWRGVGPLPDAPRAKLRETVQKAHKQGRLIRFWGAPDRPAAWRELWEAGVDLINTDDLTGLREFIRSQ